MKKVFRQKMNFDKAMLIGSLEMGASGLSLPYIQGADYTKEFSTPKDWLMQFGSLWSSINDPKFYADIAISDIMPKAEDFIEVPFRLLTATTVGAGTWKATDFSNVKVLKESMSKLEGKPVYKDHETDLDNWVGLVRAVKWSGATTQNGVTVPAGIDGLVAIDAKTNPKIARGVLLGSIFSNSVTVDFEWEMSHDFENEWDFYDRVGTMGSDGKMVRRLVKNIHDYYESSLVWLGADPFAKARTEDGGLMHIDESSIYEYAKVALSKEVDKEKYADETDISKEILKNSKKIKINFALDKNVLSLANRKTVELQKIEDMDKFLLAFIAAFGESLGFKKDQTVTPEEAIAQLSKIGVVQEADKTKVSLADAFIAEANKFAKDGETLDFTAFLTSHTFVEKGELTKLTGLSTEVETLTAAKTALETKVTELTPDATLGQSYTKQKKDEAVRLYKVAVGEANADATVIGLFEKATDKEVEGLLKQYTKSATAKFSGSCATCGSHDFKFQSSIIVDADANDVADNLVVTAEDFRAKFNKPSMTIGRTLSED